MYTRSFLVHVEYNIICKIQITKAYVHFAIYSVTSLQEKHGGRNVPIHKYSTNKYYTRHLENICSSYFDDSSMVFYCSWWFPLYRRINICLVYFKCVSVSNPHLALSEPQVRGVQLREGWARGSTRLKAEFEMAPKKLFWVFFWAEISGNGVF